MDLKTIREKIDQIDTAIVALLALRAEQSKAAKEFKSAGKIQDPEREAQMELKWETQAKALGLDKKFVLEILHTLLKESRRLQSE